MAVRQTYSFDAGPAGAAITTGGDIIAVNGATYTADAKHGSFAARMANGSQYVRVYNSGTATHSGSVYVKVTADPGTSSARIVTLSSDNGTVLMAIRAHSDNKFDIGDTTGTRRVASTVTWTLNQWHRLDWQWNQTSTAAPTLTVRIFLNPEATMPSQTLAWTASGLTAVHKRWLIALAASSGFNGVIDTFRVADGLEWIGPYAPAGPSPGSVTHLWAGAPTETGFRVVALTGAATSTRLKVCTDAAMSQNPVFTSSRTPDTAGYVSHTVTGLASNTQYYYQLEDTPAGGALTLIGEIGKARTLPLAGQPQNFTFAFGSCVTNNAANGQAFTDVLNWNPLFFIHMGDFHYRDPTSTDAAVHAQLWANQIAGVGGGALKTFVRDMPMFYVRSDHDAGPGDNRDSNNLSTRASIDGYLQVVPAPILADTRTPIVGLYYSWVVGRVRFIAVDIRNTDRTPGLEAQSPSKTMLGATQKQWLKDQLVMEEPVKVIISDVPWSGPASTADGEDKWWSYDNERTEIGNFITANNVKCVMLTGDAHSLVADSGTHNAWGGFPIYGASPMANIGGGRNLGYYDQVYNTGSAQGRQYGRVTVTDDGATITLLYQGWDAISQSVKVQQTNVFGGTPSPAANIRQAWLFDTGPSGTAITTGGDLIQATGVTYSTDSIHGPYAASIANGSQNFRIINSGTVTQSGSLYVKMTSKAASSSARIITFGGSDNSFLLAIRFHSDTKVDITTVSSRVAVSSASWTLNQWHRLDWQWNQASVAAPSLTVRFFADANAEVPTETLVYTASGLTQVCQRWTFGLITSTAGFAGVIDTVRFVDGQQWMGPYIPESTMRSGSIWDASQQAWVPLTANVSQDGKNIPAIAYVYQDGAWVATE